MRLILQHRIVSELDALQAEADALKRLQAGRFAWFRYIEIKSRRQE